MEKWIDLDGENARTGDDGARLVRNEWYILDPDEPQRRLVRYVKPGNSSDLAVVSTEDNEQLQVEAVRLRLQAHL